MLCYFLEQFEDFKVCIENNLDFWIWLFDVNFFNFVVDRGVFY